jgi:hypothetical protein
MLHDYWSYCPTDLIVCTGELFRDCIHIPDALGLVQIHEVRDSRTGKDESLRTAAKSWHLVYTLLKLNHRYTTSSKEQTD